MDNGKKLSSDEALGHYREGLRQSGLYEHYDAIIAFKKAADLDPEKLIYWLDLGAAFNYVALFDEAINAFDRALLLEPGNKKALFGKDVAMRRLPGQTKFYINMGWKIE